MVQPQGAPFQPPPPAKGNSTKIALWTIGIFLLVFIVGIGSCTYMVGRRVRRGLQEAKRAVDESKSARAAMADRDVCTLITAEELGEIYKRTFNSGVRGDDNCRYDHGVSITVKPDFLQFVQALGQYHARPHRIHGARGFFASGKLYISYRSLFIQIQPMEGDTDAEEIAERVLARL